MRAMHTAMVRDAFGRVSLVLCERCMRPIYSYEAMNYLVLKCTICNKSLAIIKPNN